MKTIFFMLFSLPFFLSLASSTTTHSSPVPALYAFGDSTVDSGNNNRLLTLYRSDHYPYGQDFTNHVPTGRFSNGRLATDFIVSGLGIKDQLPAALDPKLTGDDLLTGVSFGSAGSGLDDATSQKHATYSMRTQLDYFEQASRDIKNFLGESNASNTIGNSIFVVSAGTNDMLEYYSPSSLFGPSRLVSDYHNLLLQNLESIVKRLYKLGARRLLVVGLPPIGCLPFQVTMGSLTISNHMFQRQCVETENTDSVTYNAKLQHLISNMQSDDELKGAKVAYFDIYTPIMDMITHPAKYGFERTTEGCCGSGMMEAGPLCDALLPACRHPSRYVFWDAVHPTEAANFFLAQQALQSPIKQLLA